jgi:hypothetical protein
MGTTLKSNYSTGVITVNGLHNGGGFTISGTVQAGGVHLVHE